MTRAKGTVLVIAGTMTGLVHGVAAALAAGNSVSLKVDPILGSVLNSLPPEVALRVSVTKDDVTEGAVQAILVEGDSTAIGKASALAAQWRGPVINVQGASAEDLASGIAVFAVDLLVDEVATSINTAAAGGNASLMALA